MTDGSKQPELSLEYSTATDTITINGRCTLRRDCELCAVCVAGLPVHHWTIGDRMAEAYVMVSLVQCGYADQNEVALAFGCSARTLRRHQRRYEAGGMSTLGKSPWRPQETQAEPSPWVRTAAAMQRNGMSIRDIAHRIKVSKTTVNKWLNRFGKWVVESRGALPQPQKDRVSNPSVDSATPISANSNVRGWSLDADPRNRVFDRLFARLGMLEDATPLFSPGKRIPRAGVLLAVPVLVESGIVSL